MSVSHSNRPNTWSVLAEGGCKRFSILHPHPIVPGGILLIVSRELDTQQAPVSFWLKGNEKQVASITFQLLREFAW